MNVAAILEAVKSVIGIINPAHMKCFARPIAPDLRIEYAREGRGETITLQALHCAVTKVVVEPEAERHLSMDPSEIPYLEPGSPFRAAILMEDGTPKAMVVSTLVDYLDRRTGAKLRVYFRFTDSSGRRWRIPFVAEKIGARHLVHWTPGRIEKATPDW